MKYTAADRLLVPVPSSIASDVCWHYARSLRHGATMVVVENLNRCSCWLLSKRKMSAVYGVPTMFIASSTTPC